MTKLFYSPTSCGAASFISAFAERLPLEVEQVDIVHHKCMSSGADFMKVNPKGNVPCLVMDDGTMAIAEMKPEAQMTPTGNGRYKEQAALSFCASELHATLRMFFYASRQPEAVKSFLVQMLDGVLHKMCEAMMKDERGEPKRFLVGDRLTVADTYAYIVLGWISPAFCNRDLSQFPVLKTYWDSLNAMPEIQAAKKRMAENPARVC